MSSGNLLRKDVSDFLSYKLGWNKLRKIQKESIPTILEGNNAILIASTASGKTEAALIPVLNQMLKQKSEGFVCIYFAPLRALINDIYWRVYEIFTPFGFEVGRWHGEVSSEEKRKVLKECQIIITTPESIEGLLDSKKAQSLFGELRYVVIDEVHNFIEGPRGAHLACLNERLESISKHELQRIAMSATVGNPEVLEKWLRGSSLREVKIINDSSSRKKEIEVYHCNELSPEEYIKNELENELKIKILVFGYSRSEAEEFSNKLNQLGIKAPVHHSSVSKSLREIVEEEFKKNTDLRVVVATSTLELGINIGDVDRVVFLDVPPSCSSFLQRIGRSGRKRLFAKATIFLKENSLYRMIGIIKMLERNTVEGIYPTTFFPQLLAHQIIGIVYSYGKLTKTNIENLKSAYPFEEISSETFKSIIKFLVDSDYLIINSRGEAIPSGKTFDILEIGSEKMNHVVTFAAKSQYLVVANGVEIGYLHPVFVHSLKDLSDAKDAAFILGGKVWKFVRVDEKMKTVQVKRGEGKKIPSWISPGVETSFDFSRAIFEGILDFRLPDYIKLSPDSSDSILNLIDEEKGFLNNYEDGYAFEIKGKKTSSIHIRTFSGERSNTFIKYLIFLTDFEVKKIKVDWREISFESKSSLNDIFSDLDEIVGMQKEEIINSISKYLLNSEKEMKKLYSTTGDRLDKYMDKKLQAEYLARYLFNEKTVEILKSIINREY